MSKAKKAVKRESLFKKLLERRVFQVLGVYLGVSWGLIQFVDWVVNRYQFSIHLTEFAFVLLLSMLPTVIMLTYFHNDPHRENWGKLEKISIPANVVFSITLLLLLFQGKELGAASKTVTVTDENGQEIQRLIPKDEFLKKIHVTFFENRTGDKDLNWLRLGMGVLIDYDLEQDFYVQSISGLYLHDEFQKLGFDIRTAIPEKVQSKVAQNSYVDYLLNGDLYQEGRELVLRARLIRVENNRKLYDLEARSENAFDLVDDLVTQLKEKLKIPRAHLENTKDLALRDLLTQSEPAARELFNGLFEINLNNDYQKALGHIKSSLALDSTFAFAHIQDFVIEANLGNNENTQNAIKASYRYQHKLPEFYQFLLKSVDYQLQGKTQKRIAVLKMWAELHPQAIMPLRELASVYRAQAEYDLAIATYEQILERDRSSYYTQLAIGDAFTFKGDYPRAIEVYTEFKKNNPQDPAPLLRIAIAKTLSGEFEAAEEILFEALEKDPDRIRILLEIGKISFKRGHFDKAEEWFTKAREESETNLQQYRVLSQLNKYYLARLDYQKALEYGEEMVLLRDEVSNPLDAQFTRIELAATYLTAGYRKKGDKILNGIKMVPPFDKAPAIGRMIHAVEMRDTTKIKKEIGDLEEFYNLNKIGFTKVLLNAGLGILYAQRGDYQKAETVLSEALKISETSEKIVTNLATVYLKSGELDKGIEIVRSYLFQNPYSGDANLIIADLYAASGQNQLALEALEKAQKNLGPGQFRSPQNPKGQKADGAAH